MWLKVVSGAVALAAALAGADFAAACTRVLWNDNGQSIVVGRDMGWVENMRTNLWVFPRGIERSGLAGDNSLKWASKFGSVTASSYDIATSDGMNEKGLVANMLWLTDSDYGKRDTKVPGLAVSLWAQYMLDNYATVAEAVTATERRDYQIVPVSLKVAGSEVVAEIHLSLADASGDSAVIEFVDGGTPRIHRGRSVTVLTNEPLYEEQLENLKHYQGFGGTAPLPGTGSPLDRFVRASYYLKDLERPKDTRAAIAGVLSIVRNVSVPLVKPVSSAESPFDSVFSVWHTVADATDRIYFFESTQAPVLVWVDLDDLDLKPGAPVLKLDLVNGGDLAGDMAKSFKPSTPMQFRKGSTDLASGGRPQAESNL